MTSLPRSVPSDPPRGSGERHRGTRMAGPGGSPPSWGEPRRVARSCLAIGALRELPRPSRRRWPGPATSEPPGGRARLAERPGASTRPIAAIGQRLATGAAKRASGRGLSRAGIVRCSGRCPRLHSPSRGSMRPSTANGALVDAATLTLFRRLTCAPAVSCSGTSDVPLAQAAIALRPGGSGTHREQPGRRSSLTQRHGTRRTSAPPRSTRSPSPADGGVTTAAASRTSVAVRPWTVYPAPFRGHAEPLPATVHAKERSLGRCPTAPAPVDRA